MRLPGPRPAFCLTLAILTIPHIECTQSVLKSHVTLSLNLVRTYHDNSTVSCVASQFLHSLIIFLSFSIDKLQSSTTIGPNRAQYVPIFGQDYLSCPPLPRRADVNCGGVSCCAGLRRGDRLVPNTKDFPVSSPFATSL